MRPLLRALGTALFGALVLLAPSASAEQCSGLELPADALDSTLLRVGRQTSISILFRREHVEPHLSKAVVGEVGCLQVLEAALEGTGLGVRRVGDDVFVVRPVPRNAAVEEVPVPAGAQRIEVPDALTLEEIIVRGRGATGSRVRDMSLDGSAQIDVIDRFEIERAGYHSLSEVLRFLPAVAGNATSTYVTNGGDSTATVTLRGLPATHTLVLLNGRRMNTDALSGQAVDLNTIPLAAIERIEVLKDGASAIYGSDAIAGVVNIVTRNRLQGLHLSTYGGVTNRDDLRTFHHSLLFGHDGPRHQFVIGGEVYDQEAIFSRDRSASRTSDDRLRGGIDRRSSATAPARIALPTGAVTLSDGATGVSAEDFRPATDADRFDFRDFTTALVPSQRESLFAEGEFDLADGLTVFAEFLHTRTNGDSQLAPVPLFTGFAAVELEVAADAAFNPFGIPLRDIRRRIVELPPREQSNRTETQRFVAGVRRSAERWDLELNLSQHETRARERLTNVLFGPNLARAIGPANGCSADPACAPLNLFGPPGSIDAAALDFVSANQRTDGEALLRTFAVTTSRQLADLPAGSMKVAAGAEWREETLDVKPDMAAIDQLYVGGANFGASDGDRTVGELHAELLVPLLAARPGAYQLDLQVADRYSNYSDFGDTHNPKVTLRWRPVSSLLVRGGWGRGFRAPTLRELHLAVQQSAAFIVDPCADAMGAAILPGCRGQADPTLNQFLTLTGGNANLRAEQARSRTFGFVWTPARARGELTMAVDLYEIDEENVVDASAQFVVDENARTGAFADRIVRDAAGNLQSVRATNLNIGTRELSGADVAVDWKAPASRIGLFELALKGSHIRRFTDQLDPASMPVDRAGTFQDAASEGNGALPDWKVNLGVTWLKGPWETRYGLHYVSPLKEVIPGGATERSIGAWTTHNLQLGYRWHAPLHAAVSLGIRNLLDAPPPFVASAFNDSIDARTHDLVGRFLYTRLSVQL